MTGLKKLLGNLFPASNERKIKAYQGRLQRINDLEAEIKKLSDDDIRRETRRLRQEVARGAPLDSLLPRAFAMVREAAERTLKQRHFDVQMIGGIALHEGKIVEMKTGEGKTLVSTLAVYLNALSGKGVHLVTVNDYLARRDAEWMGEIYKFLDLSVGCIQHGLTDEQRARAYAADVTYSTNNELGFDYLRDNMKYAADAMAQRSHAFAIVDEVDSILIDEARTPLIISGAVEDQSKLYIAVDRLVEKLGDDDFECDEKTRNVFITESGNEHCEKLLRENKLLADDASLYDVESVNLVHHLSQALRAQKMFLRDRDYIVKDGKVTIIDEFTGRMMPGRRFSEGLHQALEAKENVQIEPENQTLASITFQNYFRLYDKLAGMTGTAATEAEEFAEIYQLDVVSVPTHMPISRIDEDDEIYRSRAEKYNAVIAVIKDCVSRRQPALVGTVSIEKSEQLSEALKKENIEHAVLNARYHEQEAQIIALAGMPGSVTIATNMAGRGTDIQLGGNPDIRLAKRDDDKHDDKSKKQARQDILDAIERDKKAVIEAGGLFVIGTERHESRRIDNQLRGRSGRQGDPGRSRFFLSLDDDLMRIFGPERIDAMLNKLQVPQDEAITHPWISKAIERAQKKVEAHNFDIRKNLLNFDNVMNDQRKVVFEQRLEMMHSEDMSEIVAAMRRQAIADCIALHIPPESYPEQWSVAELQTRLKDLLGLDLPIVDWADEEGIADQEINQRVERAAHETMARRAADIKPRMLRHVEKSLLMQSLDMLWREHLQSLEHLRQVVGLRGYGQRHPLNEYKTESFELFESMLNRLRETVTRSIMHLEFERIAEAPPSPLTAAAGSLRRRPAKPAQTAAARGGSRRSAAAKAASASASAEGENDEEIRHPVRSRRPLDRLDPDDPLTWGRVSRNAACPCGSGKKFKHCCGKI